MSIPDSSKRLKASNDRLAKVLGVDTYRVECARAREFALTALRNLARAGATTREQRLAEVEIAADALVAAEMAQ